MSKSRFIETIKVKDGQFYNQPLHIARVLRTVYDHFGTILDLHLTENIIPQDMKSGTVKCRIVYSDTIESLDFERYSFRDINSLALVHDDRIEYTYKAENREQLQALLALKKDCDDILIVKNGYITDTSYSNIVFENEEGLFTPRTPLLEGTKRRYLLNCGTIKEADITTGDLHKYTSAYLINAMIDIEDNISIGINDIRSK